MYEYTYVYLCIYSKHVTVCVTIYLFTRSQVETQIRGLAVRSSSTAHAGESVSPGKGVIPNDKKDGNVSVV